MVKMSENGVTLSDILIIITINDYYSYNTIIILKFCDEYKREKGWTCGLLVT